MVNLSEKTRLAFYYYGHDACRKAWDMSNLEGYGAAGIAFEGPSSIKTTQQADAAINAWNNITEVIKSLATIENAARYKATDEKFTFCLDLLDISARPLYSDICANLLEDKFDLINS